MNTVFQESVAKKNVGGQKQSSSAKRRKRYIALSGLHMLCRSFAKTSAKSKPLRREGCPRSSPKVIFGERSTVIPATATAPIRFSKWRRQPGSSGGSILG